MSAAPSVALERARPVREHVYQNHSVDSTRWDHFIPRAGDVVVASSYKSGTTWMQFVVLRLTMPDVEISNIPALSPWLDSPLVPIEQLLLSMKARPARRVIKTHLPLDAVPYFPQVKYIVVCRDPRDVFMSLWNHYQNVVPFPFLSARTHPGRVGGPLPPCPADVNAFWRAWTTRGWFAWEHEGYPFWCNLRHTQTWWRWRKLENMLFVHFDELLLDLPSQVRRIADHLECGADNADVRAVADAARFEAMKRNANELLPFGPSRFAGGGNAFLFQGTNGRWRGVLTPDELRLLDVAVAAELSPDCASWLLRAPTTA